MMYQTLAPYYDALVQDEAATNAWLNFVNTQLQGNRIMELACGSGDLAIALAKQNNQVFASDISEEMLKIARAKPDSDLLTWACMDMRSIECKKQFDAVLCFCDSLNYILEEGQLTSIFTQVYEHLDSGGVFLFDLHSYDRLDEFKEEYCEDGYIDEHAYEWTILAEDNYLYQNFAFYDTQAHPHLEQHIQKVYDPKCIDDLLRPIGFQVSIYTDFDQPGVVSGEKYFFVCKKGS